MHFPRKRLTVYPHDVCVPNCITWNQLNYTLSPDPWIKLPPRDGSGRDELSGSPGAGRLVSRSAADENSWEREEARRERGICAFGVGTATFIAQWWLRSPRDPREWILCHRRLVPRRLVPLLRGAGAPCLYRWSGRCKLCAGLDKRGGGAAQIYLHAHHKKYVR